MLRKLTHIFLSVLLLISTCGMAYTRHFCGQNLVAIQWFGTEFESEEDECCGGNEDFCCQDELVQINPLQTEVTLHSIQNVLPSYSDAIFIGYPTLTCNFSYTSDISTSFSFDDGPPLPEDLIIVNRCFLI